MSDSTEEMALLNAETDFGLAILNQNSLAEPLVFSPLSIALALSLVHAGAKGNTKQQIENVVNKGANSDQFVQYYSNLSKAVLAAQEGVEVDIANRMFIKNTFTVNPDYLAAIKNEFNAESDTLNFDDGAGSAMFVNDFVTNATHGKITEIVQPDGFADALAFLVNAVYLDAKWEAQFYKYMTHNATFYCSANKEKEISFMKDTEIYRFYTENSEVQVLSLKYKDSSFAFNIFLPKVKFGLESFIKSLTGAKLQNLLGAVADTYVSVTIPKMKIEKGIPLKDNLLALGITDMFSDNADLTGIAEQIKVSDAAHKAMIEVDEEGTVAAAVTAVKIVPMSLNLNTPKQFVADHPFLFVLTQNQHPLFMGAFN